MWTLLTEDIGAMMDPSSLPWGAITGGGEGKLAGGDAAVEAQALHPRGVKRFRPTQAHPEQAAAAALGMRQRTFKLELDAEQEQMLKRGLMRVLASGRGCRTSTSPCSGLIPAVCSRDGALPEARSEVPVPRFHGGDAFSSFCGWKVMRRAESFVPIGRPGASPKLRCGLFRLIGSGNHPLATGDRGKSARVSRRSFYDADGNPRTFHRNR